MTCQLFYHLNKFVSQQVGDNNSFSGITDTRQAADNAVMVKLRIILPYPIVSLLVKSVFWILRVHDLVKSLFCLTRLFCSKICIRLLLKSVLNISDFIG